MHPTTLSRGAALRCPAELLPGWGLSHLTTWLWLKVTDGGELVGRLVSKWGRVGGSESEGVPPAARSGSLLEPASPDNTNPPTLGTA